MKSLKKIAFLLIGGLSLTFVSAINITDVSGPPCNSLIARVSLEEIQSVVAIMVEFLSDRDPEGKWSDEKKAIAAEAYLGNTQYAVQAHKVCGSCPDVMKELYDDLSTEQQSAMMEYCGEGVYGADAIHSALLFLPETEDEVILKGVRNAHVNFQSTRMEKKWASSTFFPSSVTERIGLTDGVGDFINFYTSFVDNFSLMISASSGLIALSPDYIGLGESADTHDRSYLTAIPVKQAAVVSFYAASDYTERITRGCTEIGDRLITSGYSSAGASVVFATLGLESTGLNIARMFTQAAPYSNALLPQAAIGQVASGIPLSFEAAGFWAFLAAVYSSEQPYLPNTGTGQTILSAPFLDASNPDTYVPGWFFGPDYLEDNTQIRSRYPKTFPEFLGTVNPALLAAVQAAGATNSICQQGFDSGIEDLCTALVANSPFAVWDQVLAAQIPIEWCHSSDDTTVPFLLTQNFLLGILGESNVDKYQAPVDFLGPKGGHEVSHIYCAAAFSTFLTGTNDEATLMKEVGCLSKKKKRRKCYRHDSSDSSSSDDSSKPSSCKENKTRGFKNKTNRSSGRGGGKDTFKKNGGGGLRKNDNLKHRGGLRH